MNTRGKIIIGNWKLNGSKQLMQDTLLELGHSLDQPDAANNFTLAICSPGIYVREMIQLASQISRKLFVGCKNINTDPHTFNGELSAPAAKKMGCKLCLVGHAERRSTLNEGNYSYHLKVKQLMAAGLAPALCIGETLEEKLAGKTCEVLHQQLAQTLEGITLDANTPLYIVYEPAYALSSSQALTPVFAQAIHADIRRLLAYIVGPTQADKIAIIYGGSVNHDNALSLITQPDVDGLLIGCANSNLQHFRAICNKVFALAPVFNYTTEHKDYENYIDAV